MKALLSALVIFPASGITLATVTASAVYAVAAVIALAVLLLFVLAVRREIAIHIEWGKEEKKIWFERIPRRARR